MDEVGERLARKHVIAPNGWHGFIERMRILPDGSAVAVVIDYDDLELWEIEQIEGEEDEDDDILPIGRLHFTLGDLKFVVPDSEGNFNVLSFEQMDTPVKVIPPTDADDLRDMIQLASMYVLNMEAKPGSWQASAGKLRKRMQKWMADDKARRGLP